MKPPPSRYRVVERGGRLVVIDSVAGGTPPTARELLNTQYPRQSRDPEPQTSPQLALELDVLVPSSPAYTRSSVAPPPGFLRNVAATVCSDERDADGRLQWTTARWFDARGPRTVTLSARTELQLAIAILTLLAVAFFAMIAAIAMGLVGWVILVIAGTSLPKARPAVTGWIDKLAQP